MVINCNEASLQSSAPIESSTLDVAGHRVHYLKAGSGPPIVLLHGGASDCRDWKETMTALSPSYSVYAPDMIGFGLSDRNSDGYYLSDFVDSTIEFIDALGLSSQTMVGHSLGGRVCLEVAYRHPDKVKHLVLVDTIGFRRLSVLGTVLGTAAWGMRKVLGQRQPFPKLLLDDSDKQHWMCLHKLPQIDIPTLIVWSRHDPYVPVDGAIKAKDLLPQAKLEIFPGYGHAPHVNKREAFNGLLLRFLNHDH